MLSKANNPQEQQYMITRFKEEAKILRNLRHSNLPGVIDYFIEAGRYYLVMDYIEGRDLGRVLEGYGGSGIPESLVIEWARQILDALDYLHSQSPPIVYRDLKPDNVMLQSSDQKIMLVDFGIARTLQPGSDTTKTSIGTPSFAPREIFEGKPEKRSDIYSLGATMHCLLTGIVPSCPFSFQPVRENAPGVSIELDRLVMEALQMKPKDRFKSAKAMRDALDGLSSGMRSQPLSSAHPSVGPTVKAPSPSQPAPVSKRQHAQTPQAQRNVPSAAQSPTTQASPAYVPQAFSGGARSKSPLIASGGLLLGIFLLSIILLLGGLAVNFFYTSGSNTSLPSVSSTTDGAEMMQIPAGEFLMGSADTEGGSDEHPQHKVYLDAYYIYKYEVMNRQSSKFVDERGYKAEGSWSNNLLLGKISQCAQMSQGSFS